MGTITRSMNSLRAGVKGNGSSCRDDSERSPLRRRRPDVLPLDFDGCVQRHSQNRLLPDKNGIDHDGPSARSRTTSLASESFLPVTSRADVGGFFSTELASKTLHTAWRESCRRSDAGFSRIPNWSRRCMLSYLNSSWKDSPFVVGFEGSVCWLESQDRNCLSLLQTSFRASVTKPRYWRVEK